MDEMEAHPPKTDLVGDVHALRNTQCKKQYMHINSNYIWKQCKKQEKKKRQAVEEL